MKPAKNSLETILVVEDDPIVLESVRIILEEAGFAVIEAVNAPAALKLLERHDDVRALFTDVDMPGGMNGLELARIVQTRWPHIALIVTSGVCRPSPDQLPEDGVFVGKPYSPQGPVRVIRELIQQRLGAG